MSKNKKDSPPRSKEELNNITQEREVLRAIANGVAQLEDEKGIPHREVISHLRKMKERWK